MGVHPMLGRRDLEPESAPAKVAQAAAGLLSNPTVNTQAHCVAAL
jgi:hypothetical protein